MTFGQATAGSPRASTEAPRIRRCRGTSAKARAGAPQTAPAAEPKAKPSARLDRRAPPCAHCRFSMGLSRVNAVNLFRSQNGEARLGEEPPRHRRPRSSARRRPCRRRCRSSSRTRCSSRPLAESEKIGQSAGASSTDTAMTGVSEAQEARLPRPPPRVSVCRRRCGRCRNRRCRR